MSSVGVTARIQRQQQRNAGVGTTCGNPMSYRGQDYQKLREECLRNGSLFEDDHFPAAPSSLGFKELGPNSSKTRGVQWVRPKDMFPQPQFIIGGATRTDICQGSLGDCWLLAAIASLTLNEKLLARVAPSDQSFDDDYAGIFHFQFWQYGEWVDVVIDDRLPVKAGELVFVHSVDNNEFWGALLEKAYAKLNGSYEALSGGSTSEGFEDFTGGVTESFDLDKPPRNLWTIMQKATQRGSLMGCSINITNTSDMEAVTSRKLVKGHAYSVTGVDEVHYNGQTVRLVRTRNPWGQVEWTGAWSDSSALWDDVYESERDRLQVDFEDGEFWMSFDDWLRQYSRLEICNLTPDTLDDESLKHWHSVTYPGSWVRGSSAGGCRNYPNSFWSNPQYRLRLEEEDDDPEDGEDGCTFVLGLMQKNRRKEKRHGIEMQTIGFTIYEIPEEFVGQPQVKMSKDFFLYHASAARSEVFVNTREVSQRFRLPAGEYLVMPSTFEPNQESDFVVRVFSEKLNPTDVMDDEVEIKTPEVSEDDDDDIDPSFVAIFEKLAGTDGEISPKELQNILARILRKHENLKTDGFSLDACRNIVALLDKDCSGKLGLKEFNFLWKRIKTWQQIYKQFDMDNSGAFNSFEMRLALKEAGYQLNDKLTEIIISRYRDDDMTIDFDNFICCLVRLEAMSSMFRVMDQGGEGTIKLNLAQFLNITVIG